MTFFFYYSIFASLGYGEFDWVQTNLLEHLKVENKELYAWL